MNAATEANLKSQLLDRRHRLENAIADVGEAPDLTRLLLQVDSALERMDARSFGFCEVCKETVDDDFLEANPLIQYCLCRLSEQQQRALEKDIDLATRVQLALLPKQDLRFAGWEVHYRYEPAGPVSGDYCDAVTRENGDRTLLFMLGDVSGKGVAASFLMARLNATFRSLIDTGLPLDQLVERASRIFGETAIASHYATLVCGKASASGEIELCNAGHCPPLLLGGDEVAPIGATGFPVGIFASSGSSGSSPYSVQNVRLAPGDTLFLYSDGLTEARDERDSEFGVDRLRHFLHEHRALSARALAAACLKEQASFLGGAPRADDLTIMVVRRAV